MDWWIVLAGMFAGIILLLLTGLPVAFVFILVSLVGTFIFWGGEAGLRQFILSSYSSVNDFILIALPLFFLMGELLMHSGIAVNILDAMGKWLGRMPGKLGVLAVGMGTLLSVLSGVSSASTAILGTTLTPEMERRGYKKPMSLGPILGSGGLAVMIPPSGLAILIGGLGGISVSALLIAGIVPGLMMALFYTAYIVIRCLIQPQLAPPYDVAHTPLREKIALTTRYILPIGLVVFMVLGFMFLGIATPSEAAATGALGSFILVVIHGRLTWDVLKKSFWGTAVVTGMMFLIIAGASVFSQIMSFSGATSGLVKTVAGLTLAPVVVVIMMQATVLLLGTIMNLVPIILITLPVFMPVIKAMDINGVWFGVLMMLSLEMSVTTPPFGTSLFIMKAVAPPDTTMGDVIKAALPFLGCDLMVMILLLAFPTIAIWLPGLMR